jgi:hypothetical protein
MEKTMPHPYLGREFIGYVLNTPFAEESQKAIQTLQQKFANQFGDAIYLPKPGTLHITLMDWLAPLVDYDRDKDELIKEIYDEYDKALEESIEDIAPIAVTFNNIGVSKEAIYLMGEDQGQYQEIRNRFLGKVTLLPNTKRPPQIIHTTIARYLEPIDFEPVQDFVATQSISFPHTTDMFRLFRTVDTEMDIKNLLKVYRLE